MILYRAVRLLFYIIETCIHSIQSCKKWHIVTKRKPFLFTQCLVDLNGIEFEKGNHRSTFICTCEAYQEFIADDIQMCMYPSKSLHLRACLIGECVFAFACHLVCSKRKFPTILIPLTNR